MKSLKTLLVGTTLAGALLMGAIAAHADTAYTVQSGDSLSTISQQFVGSNDLIQDIASANNIDNIHMIYVGQQLTIPTDNDSQAATTTATESTSAVQSYTAPVTETAATTEDTSSSEATTTATTADTTEDTTSTEATSSSTASTSSSDSAAKEWIAQKESSGSYTATNGQYIGRYQLSSSYLNGDYSAANQEKVAEAYVSERYGSWTAAQEFWVANGWY
ncbi:MAG: LysM peptidoglycan-binding domain-containing protein [Enterococcus sp.]